MFSNLKISILFGRLAHQRLIFTYNDPRCIAVRQTHNHHYTSKQRKLAVVAAFGSLTLLFGGIFTYAEVQSLKQNLQLTTGIVDLQRNREDYIYVKKETILRYGKLQGKMKELKKWKRLWFPWLQSKSHNPWTLLQLAHSKEHSVRLLGVKALAADHGWSDADFQMVSQALNDKTMVGLARTPNADIRFFRKPPKLPTNKISMEERLRKLLVNLPTDGVELCTLYFTSQVLDEAHNQAAKDERGGLWCFGGTGLSFPQVLSPVPDEVVELYCLQAMARHSRETFLGFDGNGLALHNNNRLPPSQWETYFQMIMLGYSKVKSHCPKMVELGGLQMLQELYQERSGNMKMTRNIARILANCSLHRSLHPHIIQAGWVSLLVNWARSPDLALSMHAAKALANLDTDFGPKDYMDGVYLYYPQQRFSEPIYADVVFVHGLLGGPFRTWRQGDPPAATSNTEDTNLQVEQTQDTEKNTNKTKSTITVHRLGKDFSFCWPKDWLASDCPNIRILTVEYESHLSEWAPKCPYESEKRNLHSRSIELLEKLQKAGVGDRPVIWIGHSMGGLIIKKILAMAQHDSHARRLLKRTSGIVFYSVPHRGAPLAAYGKHTKYIFYPSVEVQELNQGCEKLLELHNDFADLVSEANVPILSFGEGLKTQLPLNFKVLMVPRESSDPGIGEYHWMDNLTHLNICKPENRQSPLYQLTLQFVQSCLPQGKVKNILRANLHEQYIFPQDVDS